MKDTKLHVWGYPVLLFLTCVYFRRHRRGSMYVSTYASIFAFEKLHQHKPQTATNHVSSTFMPNKELIGYTYTNQRRTNVQNSHTTNPGFGYNEMATPHLSAKSFLKWFWSYLFMYIPLAAEHKVSDWICETPQTCFSVFAYIHIYNIKF